MEQNPEKPSQKENVHSTTSDRKGLAGFFETLLRKFQDLTHLVLVIPLYVFASACLGVALIPGIYVFKMLDAYSQTFSPVAKMWTMGFSVALGYFLYGFSLLLLLPTVNFLFRAKLSTWRGPYYSLPAIQWYIHNGLTYLMRYTFLEFLTPTPFNILFYKMMGMKIGNGTIINSTHISDPSLIELGKKVTIGGSVSIVGHYGQGGFLVLAPVKIGDKATIGLRAIIMGGADIGEGAKILPGSVVLPKTVVPAGQTWGGVPAQMIEISKLKSTRAA